MLRKPEKNILVVADTKFLKKIKHFLSLGHKFCVRNKCCARGHAVKHLCLQQFILRLQGPLFGET